MSERASMKRRVRGLLHQNWYQALAALLLAWLPVALLVALLVWLMRPTGVENPLLATQFSFSLDDPRAMLVQILAMLTDPQIVMQPLLGWLPLVGSLLVLFALIGLPICVSVSSYFLAFLRGKNPKVTSVFNCFSGQYPRVLKGSLYWLLWICIWVIVSFVVPIVLLAYSVVLVSVLGVSFNAQIYVSLALWILCALWLVVMFFVFINRMLAYSLTPTSIAAQPLLLPHRGVRLSRKLMRGCKWQLIGLAFSFIVYFIPAIVAGILLVLSPLIGLGEMTLRTVRIILWVIVAANQLAWAYVWPYMTACVNAFYIERKREALMDDELTPADFGSKPKGEREDGAKS